MSESLDLFRVEVFSENKLDTIIMSEAVDENSFMGHRVFLNDTSLKGFTKFSGVTADTDHAEVALRKMVKMYQILEGAWMESEIVFKDRSLTSLKVENHEKNLPADETTTMSELQNLMMKNGWGYSDQISFGNGKGFRKYLFIRNNWHGKDLGMPVELSITTPLDSFDSSAFFSKVKELSNKAVKAWNTMPEEVPAQNLFGAIQVDKMKTEHAFGKGNRINDDFHF